MYVPVLNYFIDIEEAIVVLCVVIVAYMGVLHLEFRQLKIISKRFGDEDAEFTKSIRELRGDLNNLGDIVKGIELDNISKHVDGTASAPAPKKKSTFRPKDLSGAKDSENNDVTASETKSRDSKPDGRSLKDKLEDI